MADALAAGQDVRAKMSAPAGFIFQQPPPLARKSNESPACQNRLCESRTRRTIHSGGQAGNENQNRTLQDPLHRTRPKPGQCQNPENPVCNCRRHVMTLKLKLCHSSRVGIDGQGFDFSALETGQSRHLAAVHHLQKQAPTRSCNT